MLQSITSSLGDNAKLMKLRENLKELPKKLLSRLEGHQEDYLLGTVSGDCNYHFTFRLEGGGYFQTGVLVASAETAPPGTGGMPVPLKCRWRRRIGDIPVEISGVTSNMYQISADDVGTHICVEAQPADADDGLSGIVQGEIGPFELDPATRRSLDNALGHGASRFVVAVTKAPGDGSSAGAQGGKQELVIYVTEDRVRVVPLHGGSERTNREVSTDYTTEFPKVVIHPLDTLKFKLIMSEGRTFHLAGTTRTARDLIALTIRCFHARKYMSTQNILADLLPVQPLGPGGAGGTGNYLGAAAAGGAAGKLESCIVIERLTKELNRTMRQRESQDKSLRNTSLETKQLQSQLNETIEGFTEVIESIQDQFSEGQVASMPPVPVERLREQLREANSHNQALQAECQSFRQQIDKIQRANKETSKRSVGGEAQRLREERQLLQARLKELSTTSGTQVREQQDQVHAGELKRCRQDVEMLHNQKEQLRRQLQSADQERSELQDNFLYVKGQLDKVQMKHAHQAASSSSGSSEVHQQREAANQVNEERNRFAKRLESVLGDAEKEKAYHEQSLERVMTANARLMEEKDRATKEVQRLSQLYAESVKQLQSIGKGGADGLTTTSGLFRCESLTATYAGGVGGNGVDPEELARVQAQMATIDEALQKKEQENDSLKTRIRKLAVS
eukprot:TRINITY_DN50634_c0_g1_i1.p1 TRINITY_DN50634_c0_g1~~TRINITY_DN50634_c0_g1_i1.p1  ORF type:complete len:678 (+),score=137.54 TRINITY_DN50634_c0_g1_i1:139-2172(+)